MLCLGKASCVPAVSQAPYEAWGTPEVWALGD